MSTIDIKANLHCRCGNSQLDIGLSTDNELVIACGQCNSIVLVVDKWPKPEVIDMKCPLCEAGKCDHDMN